MRFQHLDLNLLVALNALLAECSVSAAAERLNLTQPAVSHALSRLRQHFHDELLLSSGRRMVLTPRARMLVEPVREALAQVERVLSLAPDFDPASSRRQFVLAASDYALSVGLAKAIAAMKSRAPHVSFEVAYLNEPWLRLERGDVDLIVLPQQHLFPEHPSIELYEDEYVAVVWSGSRLAREEIDAARYFELGHVAVRFGLHPQLELAEALTLAAPRARRTEVTVHSFTLVPQLLVGTELIGTVPRRLAQICAQTLPLTIKPVPFASPPIRECAQWSKLQAADPAIAWLVHQLRA